MTTPGFLCIGAQKAGTTWLFQMLRHHPDIWLGPFKEVQFFNSLFVKQHTSWTKWHIQDSARKALEFHLANSKMPDFSYVRYLGQLAEKNTIFSEEWYRLFFSRKGELIGGDITPEYCTLPVEGIDYVLRTIGSIPVVYIIRHPVSRALSQLRMNLSRKNQTVNDILDWDDIINDWDISNRGDYIKNISRWKSRYPNDRLLFLPFQRIKSNPADFLHEVENHIGVKHIEYPKPERRVHVTEQIAIPQKLVDRIAENLQPQVDFLISEFGTDFVNEI